MAKKIKPERTPSSSNNEEPGARGNKEDVNAGDMWLRNQLLQPTQRMAADWHPCPELNDRRETGAEGVKLQTVR
ncbi:uncharacterized protein N7473_011042 [Penicillium subrubescens]|uniref:uncharacterized protein n=1 Tax=Penicillium subrubescens TaxID=1316194 RepID=UPI00254535C2|nr:uncharacterized protein N7473_011042 [Penicillium subrubescens]KAJ5884156.1 hypothetical protein N7473_011042 [Penicillium subrubescens]